MLIEVPVVFRLAREDDLPALEWMGLFSRHREIIGEAFAAQEDGDGAMLLALANGFPVGQAWLDFVERGSPGCPRLWAVRVFPPLQGVGLGGRLMSEAEQCAGERGADAVEVGVEWDNAGARRFYARLGYRPVSEEFEAVRYSLEGTTMTMDVDQQILRKSLEDA